MPRRKFTREFKSSAVRLVHEQGYTIAQAAKSLGVDPNSLRNWLEKFTDESGAAPTGDAALKAELQRLRKENARLLRERECKRRLRRPGPRQQAVQPFDSRPAPVR